MTIFLGVILGTVGFQFLQTETEEPTGGAIKWGIPECRYYCEKSCSCDSTQEEPGWTESFSCTSSGCSKCTPSSSRGACGSNWFCSSVTCTKYTTNGTAIHTEMV